jgi:hypothetical protein
MRYNKSHNTLCPQCLRSEVVYYPREDEVTYECLSCGMITTELGILHRSPSRPLDVLATALMRFCVVISCAAVVISILVYLWRPSL